MHFTCVYVEIEFISLGAILWGRGSPHFMFCAKVIKISCENVSIMLHISINHVSLQGYKLDKYIDNIFLLITIKI